VIIRATLFLAATAAASAYAVRRGGQPERISAALVVAATIATMVIPAASYRTVVWPLFAIDAALLVGLVAVALVADRFWPLYLAAVQLLTVALHGVRAYDLVILPAVYARIGGELGYLAIGILAVGTWRHWRRGDEPDWSWQPNRGEAVPDRCC
jgi:hypothetical protein